MEDTLPMQYIIIGSLVIFIVLSIRYVSSLKKQKNNVALWATIFEGISMGLVNLDMYKEAETRIEKKARRDGKDELPNDYIDPESLPESNSADT